MNIEPVAWHKIQLPDGTETLAPLFIEVAGATLDLTRTRWMQLPDGAITNADTITGYEPPVATGGRCI